jgi:hypothetical protein
MQERFGGKIETLCNGNECGVSHGTYDNDDFQIMISDLKRDGWKIVKNANGEWEHYCPDCR